MSMFDWDGDGKNTFADDYMEYQIYKETTKDLDEADNDFDDEPNILGSDGEWKDHTEDYHIPPMFREKKQPAKPAEKKKEEEKDKKSGAEHIENVVGAILILAFGIAVTYAFKSAWIQLLIIVATLVAFCLWMWHRYVK